MRVVHIITGLGDGGAEGVLFRLCTHDSSDEHIVVSLSGEGKYGSLLRSKGILVYLLHMRGNRASMAGFVRLIRLLKMHRPDVIQTWMYHADLIGGLFARLAGVKVVCWGIRHSSLASSVNKKSTLLVARACSSLSYLLPDAIVCCAFSARDTHADYGYCTAKMVVIQNGVDTDRFKPGAKSHNLLSELGIAKDMPVIGSVARHDPQKDHSTLLLALSRLAEKGFNFVCVLVGTGMVRSNQLLLEEIQGLGIENSVILLGPRPDIPELMSIFDVHVMSSSHGEGFPNVVAEAMASGTFPVSTDCGDACDIQGDEGLIVGVGDANRLADGIFRALGEVRQTACQDADFNRHFRVKTNFSLESMVGKYEALWTEQLKSAVN